MKLQLRLALLVCAIHGSTVHGEKFAERVDAAYRAKVNDVATKQQMKPKSSNFEKRVQSTYTMKVDTLHKGTMGTTGDTISGDSGSSNDKGMGMISGDNGRSNGKGKGMTSGDVGGSGKGMGKMMMAKTPSVSPKTAEPSAGTIIPTVAATTTLGPTTTFEPTVTTLEPSSSPTISTEEPTSAPTSDPTVFPTFEPTIDTFLPTTQATFSPSRSGKGMMMGKKDMNGKGMMMGKNGMMMMGKKGMGMGKMKGMKMGMAKKTDSPSASPVPTFLPTLDAPSPVASPTTRPPVNPDCVPTIGNCIATAAELLTAFVQLDNDDVVSLCGRTTITTSSTLELQANRATICCETTGCRLESDGSDSILSVTGDSVTIANLTFLNGISDTNGGNVGIFGGGSHIVVDSTFQFGAADRSGGNLYVESTGSIRIENSVFSDGIAAVNGGGVSIRQASTVTIIGSTFTANAAGEGGGLSSTRDDPAADGQVILIDDTTFDGNAAEVGGAIAVTSLGQNPTLMIMNSVFTDNFANTTAGIGAIIEFLDNLEFTLEGNTASGNFGGSDPATMCDGFLAVTDVTADVPLCIDGNENFP